MSLSESLKSFCQARLLRCLPRRGEAQFVLIFHFNQDFVPWLDFVSHAFYQPLIQLLRTHREFPVHLHLSGSCLTGLLWFNPALVELIRRGVEDGQFLLLESTWSQCLPLAVSRESFSWQLNEQRRLLDEVFGEGVRPAFWNPERTWSPEMLPLLLGEFVRCSLIEDRVLREGIGTDAVWQPLRIGDETGELELLPDSNELRQCWNHFLVTGHFAPLECCFRRRTRAEGPSLLVYAEDAEAVGLWEFEANRDHRVKAMLQRLDWLLGWLKRSPGIVPSRIPDLAPAERTARTDALPPRTAFWLEEALKNSRARHHEAGYRDGFDYLSRAPHIEPFRALQDAVRQDIEDGLTRLAGLSGQQSVPAAVECLSRRLFVHHAYEFGCPGLHGPDSTGLSRVMLARIPVQMMLESYRRDESLRRRDVDGDGRPEYLLIHPGMLAVLTDDGALRQLFRIDGSEMTGGMLPGYLLERGPGLCTENLDLRYGHPLWLWLTDAPLGAWASQVYHLRRRKFVEIPGTNCPDWPQLALVPRSSPVYLALFAGESPSFGLRKEYDCARDTLYVRYRLSNRRHGPQRCSLSLETVLAPDYHELIAAGRYGLHYYGVTGLPFTGAGGLRLQESGIGVRNSVTGTSLRLRFPRRPPDEVETFEALHALGLRLHYHFELDDGDDVQFALQLSVEQIEG